MRTTNAVPTLLFGCLLALTGCGGSAGPVALDDDQPTRQDAELERAAAIAERLPGCELAATTDAALLDALTETLATGAAPGPAVLTDDGAGGWTLTTTLVVDGGEEYRSISFAVVEDDGGVVLAPLTDAAVEASRPGVTTARLLGADDQIVQGDTPGSDGMALGYDCSLILAQEFAPPPPPPAPEVRDDLMVATPAMVAAGDVVEVTFPTAYERGIAYQLDEEVDGAWVTRWWMTSDGNGGQPTTVPAGTVGYGVEDVGVGGPGPDRVLVHQDTAPGSYRLCTANAGEDVCVLLEVTTG